MKTRKLTLTAHLLLLLLMLPGWRHSQINSGLTEHLTDEKQVEVRFATVLDATGNPICQLDLLEYPDLVPSFAVLSTEEVTNINSQSQQNMSTATQELQLPSCTDKYLNLLKEVAINNTVLNSDKPPIHKASWKIPAVLAACLIGQVSSQVINIDQGIETGLSSLSGIVSSVFTSAEHINIKEANKELELTKKYPNLYSERRKRLQESIGKLKKSRLTKLAIAIGSFCYAGTEIITYNKNSSVMKK